MEYLGTIIGILAAIPLLYVWTLFCCRVFGWGKPVVRKVRPRRPATRMEKIAKVVSVILIDAFAATVVVMYLTLQSPIRWYSWIGLLDFYVVIFIWVISFVAALLLSGFLIWAYTVLRS